MSVVIGIKYNKKIYLGCDSQTTWGQVKYKDLERTKVFQKEDLLMGIVGANRVAQIIDKGFCFPKRLEKDTDSDYIFKWACALKEKLKKTNELEGENTYMDAVLLIGYRTKLYCLDSYFGYGVHKEFAIGSGGEIATGSLTTSSGPPKARITKAIKAAAENTIYVDAEVIIKSI